MKKFYLLAIILALSVNLKSQIHWTKHPGNPVMFASPAGEWDEVLVSPATVIYQDSMYHMWYWGGDHREHIFLIGYATSPDGINWTKDTLNNPVLKSGPEGAWDDNSVITPSVLFRDSTYHMWYSGYQEDASSGYTARIGHATSTNGVDWMKDTVNNPVLDLGPVGSWDDEDVGDLTVIHDGSEYHMWYIGVSTNTNKFHMGHATSPDGSNWTKDSLNPVLLSDLIWEKGRGFECLMIVYDGTVFHLWYHGGGLFNWKVGYARSLDGVNWIKEPDNPIFKGTPGTWDAKSIVGTAIIDSAHIKFKMWYGGNSSEIDNADIGYAVSDTRVPWLSVKSRVILDSTNTMVAEIDKDGIIYIVPDGTSPVIDSIIKYKVASADALALTEVHLPLTDLSIGQYTVVAVSNLGFVSTNPVLLRVVDDATPPELTLATDTVKQGNTIGATSTKDGMLYLVIVGTDADLSKIRKQPLFRDSLAASANIPVEFATSDLNAGNYWLYAVDIYGIISEQPATVNVQSGSDVVKENTNEGISIFPNPAKELIIIETNKVGQYSIEINSINGQLIYSTRMDGSSHQIDLSSFRKGVYFITVKYEDFVTTKKIIKLK